MHHIVRSTTSCVWQSHRISSVATTIRALITARPPLAYSFPPDVLPLPPSVLLPAKAVLPHLRGSQLPTKAELPPRSASRSLSFRLYGPCNSPRHPHLGLASDVYLDSNHLHNSYARPSHHPSSTTRIRARLVYSYTSKSRIV